MHHWFDAQPGQLPTEPVGSLPRPAKLQQAVLDADAGLFEVSELSPLVDEAIRDTVAQFVHTGSPLITDGEQRRQSFATYLLDGTEATHDEVFAVFADGHHRVVPQLAQPRFQFSHWASDGLAFAQQTLHGCKSEAKLKQAVVSPAMLSLMYPESGFSHYSRDEFLEDVVRGCAQDIERCFEQGASRVSIDFTEGRLALREDLRAPWAGRDALSGFIELVNRVLDRLPPVIRGAVGVHTCPGNDRDSEHSADVDYAKLIPELMQIEAGYFLVQAAGEDDPDRVAQLIGKQLREKPGSVQPRILLGVTKPTSPRLETAQEVAQQLLRAARFIPAEFLGSTDDCGFSPYLIDEKPRHGSPDFARNVAFAKIAARVQGTQHAARELSGVAV
ncbi:MAG: hypothetical protein ACTH20_02620 [Canibacter sp.]